MAETPDVYDVFHPPADPLLALFKLVRRWESVVPAEEYEAFIEIWCALYEELTGRRRG